MANRTVYVSGCIGTSLETGKLVPGGAVPEAEQALTHLKNILLASGSNLSHVVKTTLFITDFKEYDGINEVYKKCTSISLDLIFVDCGFAFGHTEKALVFIWILYIEFFSF